MVINSGILDDMPKEYFFGNYNYAFKSDLLRFTILKKMGGIYLDTDFEALRRLEPAYLCNEFLAAYQPNGEIAVGFMAASPHNGFITHAHKSLLQSVEKQFEIGWPPTNQPGMCGPEWFTKMYGQPHPGCSTYLFTAEQFYPYSWLEKARRRENFKTTCPAAYAVHHWHGSWCK